MLDPSGNICGVTSGFAPFPFPAPDPLFPFLTTLWLDVHDDSAGVDSQQTIDFFNTAKVTQGLTAGLGPRDAKGNWLGECPDYVKACNNYGPLACEQAEQDADGDGIFDICDSCPTIFNPEQLSYNDDVDGNGWGDA